MFTSVIIPVFNESSCIECNIEAVNAFLGQRFPDKSEIICVDDGSTDNSLEILGGLAEQMPLSVLSNGSNMGKGAAIRNGMLAAKGEIRFFFDADLSTPLTEIDRFLPQLEKGFGVVIGNRKSRDARINRYQPVYRVLMGLGYTRMVNLVMGMKVSDYTCGFKAFSEKAADLIFKRARINGWSFDVEILYIAHKLGLDLCEVPVTWEDRPGTKVRLVKDTIRSFLEVLRVRRLHRSLSA